MQLGTTNEMKAGTPTMIVLQTRSDVRRCANELLVVRFNRLPHSRKWDALSCNGVNVWPAISFDCRNSVVSEAR